MKKLKIKILALFLTFSFNALTQSGPTVPCVDCENYTKRTMPLSGLWYNPEQSGVGISFEVKSIEGKEDILFGVYYGYDETGIATWHTFSGNLVESSEPGTMWTLDVDLTHFKDGTCANCDYQAPVHSDFESTIQLKFKQKNYASFSIDNGVEQNIVPLDFGLDATTNFPDITTYKFPDLNGVWVFTYKLKVPFGYDHSRPRIYGNALKRAYTNQEGLPAVSYAWANVLSVEHEYIGETICELTRDDNGDIQGPSCRYRDIYFEPRTDPFEMEIFNFSIGGLGGSRMFGESVGGYTFEAIRLTRSFELPD